MVAKCIVCGKEYKYCPDCGRVESYKTIADTALCYSVYLIIIEHRDKIIDDEKALSKLDEIGVTKNNLDKFGFNSDINDRILKMQTKPLSKKHHKYHK